MTPPDTAVLFDPVNVGNREVDNRFAFVATVNYLGAASNYLNDEKIAFYAERAKGGVGMVITEGLSIHRTSAPNASVPFLWDRDQLPQFEKLAQSVQRHGSLAIGQLWHVGRNALWNPGPAPWSPSAQRDPFSGATPHAMSEAEIDEIISAYVQGAVNLSEAGMDGCELHGAHGYLITQFLSPWSNKRDDRWGGSLENRTRFLRNIIDGIREACGPDFVLGLKLVGHEYVEGGLDADDVRQVVPIVVAESRPDYIGVSPGNFSPSLEYHTPDHRFPPAPFAHLVRNVREVADGVPVMAMTKIPDLETAAALIDQDTADLIGMCRNLIADPHAVVKWKKGDTPRPCTFCNVCWHRVVNHESIACMYGPETGRELTGFELEAVPEEGRRTIRVVGAGPAGLEFARVAAARGHRVHLYEQRASPGGRLSWEAALDGREEIGKAVVWLSQAAVDAGAELTLGYDVTPEDLEDWKEDILVLATGSSPLVEPLQGADKVISLEEAIADTEALGSPIAVIDEIEDEPIYNAVELLARAGKEVHLITRRAQAGRRLAYVNVIGALRRLDELGVTVHTLTAPSRVEDGQLIASHVFSGIERSLGPVDVIVRAGPYVARDELAAAGRETVVIGDAAAPRTVQAVVSEAFDVGRRIEEVA